MTNHKPRAAYAALGLALAMATLAAPAAAAPARHHHAAKPAPKTAGAAAPTTPPKLLVAIAVDQYSADLFAQYRQHYVSGLARLMTGAVFPSAFQSHAATETCPGHSTILTGVHPSRSGIIGNAWFDLDTARPEKRVYCAEDEHDPGSTSSVPVVSAGHLRVPTLGERMKQQWPASRNVAVSAKDRAVMMMGGHDIDQAYWWHDQGFTSLKNRTLADAALEENAAMLAMLKTGAPPLTAPDWCLPRTREIKAGEVTLGNGRFAVAPGVGDDVRVSPRVDAATLDLAARLVKDMKLGKGAAPDMLSVSLSATDYIGHAYGTEGLEMCIQMQHLDSALGAFFTRLDAMGIDYAVVLTADHGGLDVPERLDQQALPSAGRVDKALTPLALSHAIAAKLGIAGPVPPCVAPAPGADPDPVAGLVCADAPFGDFWVSHALPQPTREAVTAELVAEMRARPESAAVFTHAEIAAAPIPHGEPQDWPLLARARASFDDQRSGDVVLLLKRAMVPIPVPQKGYTATHGSAWDYDRRVPLLFWRKGLAGLEQPAPVETVDIAPTLSALIGLPVPPGAYDGRCLDIDGGPADTCRGAAKVATGGHER